MIIKFKSSMFASKENDLTHLKHLDYETEKDPDNDQFPRLTEAAHFHYEEAKLSTVYITVKPCNAAKSQLSLSFEIGVWCGHAAWTLRKTLYDLFTLDHQLHVCLFDRSFSCLPNLSHTIHVDNMNNIELMNLVEEYFKLLATLINDHASSINCSLILSWFELDNKGKRLACETLKSLNIPAIAAAQVVKRHLAECEEELNIDVGDLISLIDMPSPDENAWWRGKKGYKVGMFPHDCVVVIDTKKAAEAVAASNTSEDTKSLLSSSPGAVTSSPPTAIEVFSSNSHNKPVMKNYGKMVSCLHGFFRERPSRDRLRRSGIVFDRVFGCDLGQYLANHEQDVPLVVRWCAEKVERIGIVDGVYRHSGGVLNINTLRDIFDSGQLPSENDDHTKDAHAVSCLMKTYFRELPNPLLTHALYFDFIKAVSSGSEIKEDDECCQGISRLLSSLPPPHHRTLKFIIGHLSKIANRAGQTGMTAKNLAIVWAPNLLRPFLMSPKEALTYVTKQARVVEVLITHYHLLFDKHSSSVHRTPKQVRSSAPTNITVPDSVKSAPSSEIKARNDPQAVDNLQQHWLLPLDVAQKLYRRPMTEKDWAVAASTMTPLEKSSTDDEGGKKSAKLGRNHLQGQQRRPSLKKRLAAMVRGDGSSKPNSSVVGQKSNTLTISTPLSVAKSESPKARNQKTLQSASKSAPVWRPIPRSKSESSPSIEDFPPNASFPLWSICGTGADDDDDDGAERKVVFRERRQWPLTSDNSMVWTGSHELKQQQQQLSKAAAKKAILVRGPLTSSASMTAAAAAASTGTSNNDSSGGCMVKRHLSADGLLEAVENSTASSNSTGNYSCYSCLPKTYPSSELLVVRSSFVASNKSGNLDPNGTFNRSLPDVCDHDGGLQHRPPKQRQQEATRDTKVGQEAVVQCRPSMSSVSTDNSAARPRQLQQQQQQQPDGGDTNYMLDPGTVKRILKSFDSPGADDVEHVEHATPILLDDEKQPSFAGGGSRRTSSHGESLPAFLSPPQSLLRPAPLSRFYSEGGSVLSSNNNKNQQHPPVTLQSSSKSTPAPTTQPSPVVKEMRNLFENPELLYQ